jgi:hypothetical protein
VNIYLKIIITLAVAITSGFGLAYVEGHPNIFQQTNGKVYNEAVALSCPNPTDYLQAYDKETGAPVCKPMGQTDPSQTNHYETYDIPVVTGIVAGK